MHTSSSPHLSVQGGPKNGTHSVRLNFIKLILTDFRTYHCQKQQNICNNTVTKDPTIPQVFRYVWLGGVVVRALDLRLEIAGSIPAAALSSATLDKLFTHIVQRL